MVTQTRVTTLYRMADVGPDELHRLVVDRARHDHEFREVDFGAAQGLLVAGQTDEHDVEWVRAIRALTGVDLAFSTSTSSAALFLRVDDATYALTYGHGWHFLRDDLIDHQFALRVAVRTVNPDEIRDITRWALSAKARVDRNLVPARQGLWEFGLREHAEIIRQLNGRARLHLLGGLTHVRERGDRKLQLSLDCGQSLKVPLAVDRAHLVGDLRALSAIERDQPPHDQLAPLLWVRRVPSRTPQRAELDGAVAELLAEPDPARGEIGVAYPARYYEGPDIHYYTGRVAGTHLRTEELTCDHLAEPLAALPRDEWHRALSAGRIEGRREDDEELGGELPALHWLAAEIADRDARYILIDGDWYRIGDEYLRHVRKVSRTAFERALPWRLPAWKDAPRNAKTGKVHEEDYNRYVARTLPGFLCLDRKLVPGRTHPSGFEACDLLGPDNELVHVKKTSGRTGSSPLSHLFAQGLVSMESLTDPETWHRFRGLVAQQSPERARNLGTRPHSVVYAIHRTDKPLTPETLFTFARSALASACVTSTANGIPVSVAIIP
ncbi:TIGR04141 family sporadically distributed protein [Amycolatopsis minnesotensis]|uniref:TIGR04141 family sporadically distributed protein n=1 Tax=Amycolatopsis minnesotensis TaxID=337894 RepID=A0ABN2Q9S5_9PSEU